MGFAGPKLDTLYVLNGTSISYIKLQVRPFIFLERLSNVHLVVYGMCNRCLANLNCAYNCWSSYEYLIRCQSENSHVHQFVIYVTSIMLTQSCHIGLLNDVDNFECLGYYEHVFQSILSTFLFDVRS